MTNTNQLVPQLSEYIKSIKKKEKIYILSLASIILSFLYVITGLDYFLLSILYIINISFFVFMIRESLLIRKQNIIPLAVVITSIVFTSLQMLAELNAISKIVSAFK